MAKKKKKNFTDFTPDYIETKPFKEDAPENVDEDNPTATTEAEPENNQTEPPTEQNPPSDNPPPAPPINPTPTQPTNWWALASLGLGVLSTVTGMIFGIPAIIAGIVGWKESQRTNTGRIPAIVGTTLGTLASLLTFIIVLLVVTVQGITWIGSSFDTTQRAITQSTVDTEAQRFGVELTRIGNNGEQIPITFKEAQALYLSTSPPAGSMLSSYNKIRGKNNVCFVVNSGEEKRAAKWSLDPYQLGQDTGVTELLPAGSTCQFER